MGEPNFSAIQLYLEKDEYNTDLDKNQKRAICLAAKKYFIEENALYHTTKNGARKRKVIIDVQMRESLLATVHQGIGDGVAHASLGSHLCRDKMASKLKKFWWPGIKRDIENTCRTCESCQKAAPKLDKVASELHPISVPKKVMAMIGIDICTLPKNDQGYVGIVVAVDYFSKLVIANAIEDKTAITVARFLYEEVYTRFGTPEIQINDQGREFLSQLSEVQHKMLRCTSAYHPQANGLVERCNRTIQTALLKVLGEQHDMWPAALHGVVFAFNTAKHKSTGFSPFYVVHGWHARTVTDLIAEGKTEDITEAEEEEATEMKIDIEMEEIAGHVVQLQKNGEKFEEIEAANKNAQSRQKNYNKRHAEKKVFSAGDKVLLYKDRRGGKDMQLYEVPYTVLSV